MAKLEFKVKKKLPTATASSKLEYPGVKHRLNFNWIGIEDDGSQLLWHAIECGMPANVRNAGQFLLSNHCTGFLNKKKLKISVQNQLTMWAGLWDMPLYGPYVACISSNIDDSMAKLAASRLFLRGLDAMGDDRVGRWHRVSGYHDELYKEDIKPEISMLVLTGVHDESERSKKDVLNDILEKYDFIPRVVVTSSCDVNPAEFMSSLRQNVHHPIRIGDLPDD